ncbi:MAG TPA: hypothetical protein VL988_11800 [Solirubrobacteraceae bacterium]|nr:hypothetical protein [Solirubrobacteraceae bacterium]
MSRTTPLLHVKPAKPTALRVAFAASLLAATLLVLLPARHALAAPAPAPQPAELQTLEQRMSELTVNSQRFTGSVAIGGKLPHKLAALRGLRLSYSGEQVLAPPATRVTTKLFGKPLTLLQIGDTLYVDEPALARHDGGRPWVKQDLTGKDKLFGSNPGLGSGTGLSRPGAGASGQAFKGVAELLEKASAVQALGPSTVEGQPVVGFAGTIGAQQLAEGQLPKKAIAELRRKHIKLSASLQVFIAANGVPVRTNLLLRIGKAIHLDVAADVLAVNFPVAAVPPPPAAETITAVELAKLEKARLKKAKAKRGSG